MNRAKGEWEEKGALVQNLLFNSRESPGHDIAFGTCVINLIEKRILPVDGALRYQFGALKGEGHEAAHA
jgi:hypothetical protein